MQFALRMTTMHLMQNAETIDRLVAQGEFLLKTFHAEYEKDPAGYETEFLPVQTPASEAQRQMLGIR
jgi:hypothetical protein